MSFLSGKGLRALLILSAVALTSFIFMAPRSRVDKRFSGMSPEEARVTLALNYMGDEKMPMKGILLIRQIAEKDPKNKMAIEYLAGFSMQSGQFDKAVERFAQLEELTEGDERVNAVIGRSDAYFMMGDTVAAMETLQKVFEISKDSLLLQSVQKRINELNNN